MGAEDGDWGPSRAITERTQKRGFHDTLKVRPSSLFILFGWMETQSPPWLSVPDILKRIWVFRNFITWWWLNVCSAIANLSGCPSHMNLWCFFILVSTDWPVCLYVHLARLTQCAVYPRCPQSQVIHYWTKESGDLPRRQANTFYVFGQHYAEPVVCCLDIWKKSNWGGLLFQLGCSKHRVEGTSYLLGTISIFRLVKDQKCEWTRLSSSCGD
jgi:hypothetical protein